jgi:hypothetical protein
VVAVTLVVALDAADEGTGEVPPGICAVGVAPPQAATPTTMPTARRGT